MNDLDTLLITSASGHLYKFDPQTDRVYSIFKDIFSNGYLMGVARKDNDLFLSGNRKIYKFEMIGDKLTPKSFAEDLVASPEFHHIKVYDNKLFVTSTRANNVFVHEVSNLNLITDFGFEKNPYYHLNTIFRYDDNYYVNANQSNGKFSMSSVIVFDNDFKEIDRFEYGWQTHGFSIIGGRKYALCGYSKIHDDKEVSHPRVGGFMIDGELVIEFSPNFFFKDFSVSDKYIYIVGSGSAERESRQTAGGVLLIFDHELNNMRESIFPNVGEFKGCLLLDTKDYTV
jgi:hypothetical protein